MKGIRRAVATGGFLAAAAVSWVLLAPPSLGGSIYATVAGSSMQPSLHAGDLVVLRPASAYRVGDVVAYRSSAGNVVLLHRIVAVSDGRYTLKGDANDWLDADRPRRADVLGAQWFSVPAIGGVLGGRVAMVAILVPAALLAIGARSVRRKRARAMAFAGTAPPSEVPEETASMRERTATGSAAAGMTACFVLAVMFAALGLVSVVAPAGSQGRMVAYTHEGTFDYAASVPPSAAYPDGKVSRGGPVFLRLVRELDVTFAYRLDTADAASLTGVITLSASIRDDASRWARTVSLGAPRRFTGLAGSARATLPIASLRRMVDGVEASTGMRPPHYLVEVHADVAAVGAIADASLRPKMRATVPFTMNDLTLLPALSATTGRDPSTASEFTATGSGSVRATGPAANARPLRSLPVRASALSGALIFLFMALGYAARARRDAARAGRVPKRLERLVVDARAPAGASWRTASVTVASMEDLAYIAEQASRPILHDSSGATAVYEVRDGDIVYRLERARVDLDATA